MSLLNDRDLERLRKKIDLIDARIVRLICERANVAVQVGAIKARLKMPVRHARREAEVVASALKRNRSPFSDAALKKLYRVIIAECAKIQIRSRKV